MEFLLNGQGYSIPNAIPMNNSPPASASPELFGFHSGENSQLLDSFLQSHQKMKNPADSERINPGDIEAFMISGNGAQSDQHRRVPASTVADFNYPETTPVAITELRRPSASLSVNVTGTAQVGKKRSRASRRSTTTLFNTDTANFRAMVQRFTGIPETPFRFSSMNPTFSPHVGHQGLHLLGKPLPYKAVVDGHQALHLLDKPLPYKAVIDPNMNRVSQLNSVPHGYGPQQYNSTTFLPSQFLHHNINITSPLNLFPKGDP